jgi:hypothetical protein
MGPGAQQTKKTKSRTTEPPTSSPGCFDVSMRRARRGTGSARIITTADRQTAAVDAHWGAGLVSNLRAAGCLVHSDGQQPRPMAWVICLHKTMHGQRLLQQYGRAAPPE